MHSQIRNLLHFTKVINSIDRFSNRIRFRKQRTSQRWWCQELEHKQSLTKSSRTHRVRSSRKHEPANTYLTKFLNVKVVVECTPCKRISDQMVLSNMTSSTSQVSIKHHGVWSNRISRSTLSQGHLKVRHLLSMIKLSLVIIEARKMWLQGHGPNDDRCIDRLLRLIS